MLGFKDAVHSCVCVLVHQQPGARFRGVFYRIYIRFECVKMHNETDYRNGNYTNGDTKIRANEMFMFHDGHFVSVICKCYPLVCSHSVRFVAHFIVQCYVCTNESDMWNGDIT